MQNWKRFFTSLILLAGLLRPLPTQSDCGPSFGPELYTYSFLQPALANPEEPGTPYFLDFDVLYEEYGRQEVNQVEANVREWQERFCMMASATHIYELIYESTLYDLRELRNTLTSKNMPLPVSLRGNRFAAYIERNKCLETVDYLIFAKRCEPFVTVVDAWELSANGEAAMRGLIEEGLRYFLDTESYYIRLRYAYQLVRLAHYLRDYERTIELYEYLMPKIDNDPSIFDYWILGHKAGAMLKLGQRIEASYLYAKIFEHDFGKRESAYRSFDIRTEEEWQACLLLCATDKERATLYALRASAPDSKALEDMREIYRLDPDSPHLNTLLIKELKRLEKNLLGLEFNPEKQQNRRRFGIPAPGVGQYVIDLQAFVRNHNRENRSSDPALWKLAEGYLEALAGDYYQAQRTLEEARELNKKPRFKEQIEALILVARIAAFGEVNDAVEAEIARLQLDDETYRRFPDFDRFVKDKLSALYRQKGAPGKLFLQQYDLVDLKVNPQLEVVEDLQELVEKELPNRYERTLIRKSDGSSIRDDLIDMKGTYLLGQGEIVAALEEFKKMDRSKWEDYGVFNPFEEHLIDCINCSQRDSLTRYSKGVIIERILDYEYRALADRENGARYFYRIGLAYYNMSYFGYAWKAADYFRSGNSLRVRRRTGNGVVPSYQYEFGNLENFSNEKALQYFDKTIQLANNPELAASAAFMAAKCEQNEYYINGGTRTYKYFDLLVEKYSETKFYQKAIEECRYFNKYASR